MRLLLSSAFGDYISSMYKVGNCVIAVVFPLYSLKAVSSQDPQAPLPPFLKYELEGDAMVEWETLWRLRIREPSHYSK